MAPPWSTATSGTCPAPQWGTVSPGTHPLSLPWGTATPRTCPALQWGTATPGTPIPPSHGAQAPPRPPPHPTMRHSQPPAPPLPPCCGARLPHGRPCRGCPVPRCQVLSGSPLRSDRGHGLLSHPRYILGWPGPPAPRWGQLGDNGGAAGGPGGWGGARAPQLGPTWLEDTEETSVRWAELDTSESSVMGRPHTVSMMQARNCGDTGGTGHRRGDSSAWGSRCSCVRHPHWPHLLSLGSWYPQSCKCSWMRHPQLSLVPQCP